MVLKVYTIFDSAVGAYHRPFYCHGPGEAIRNFTLAAKDPQCTIFQSPADYTLFELGEWDDHTGIFQMYQAHKSLGKALEFISGQGVDQDGQFSSEKKPRIQSGTVSRHSEVKVRPESRS